MEDGDLIDVEVEMTGGCAWPSDFNPYAKPC
jgi:hypothetical protein